MVEKVFTFGNNVNLVGIVSEPDSGVTAPNSPAICILNSGLLHRVGAYRAHVLMARRLADLGYTVLRFDLSGIGDSEKHKDERAYEEHLLGDIREAFNWLSSKRGFDKFVLIGLCTGADNAHKVSVIDHRVVGAVTLDGYSYPTLKYYFHRFNRRIVSRMMNSSVWANMLKRRLGREVLPTSVAENGQEDRTVNYFWSLPKKSKTLKELEGLMSRDFKLLSIYSGSGSDYYYKDQFFDMYKSINFRKNAQVEYFARADHTYTLCKDREKMIETICSWMQSSFSVT